MTELVNEYLVESLLSLPDAVGCDFADNDEFRAVYAKKIAELIDDNSKEEDIERATQLKVFFSNKLTELDIDFCNRLKSQNFAERMNEFSSSDDEASEDGSDKDEL